MKLLRSSKVITKKVNLRVLIFYRSQVSFMGDK